MNGLLKKILLSFCSIFLMWQSYDLMGYMHKSSAHGVGIIAITAFVINLYITGIFAFAGFAFPTHKLLTNLYYKIKNPARIKNIYKLFRVDLFRQFLLATFWKSKKQQQKYFNGKKDGIPNLIKQSQKSEFGHLLPFVIIIAISIYLLTIGSTILAALTFLINIIANLYPILLQRHHRMRIEILKKRIK